MRDRPVHLSVARPIERPRVADPDAVKFAYLDGFVASQAALLAQYLLWLPEAQEAVSTEALASVAWGMILEGRWCGDVIRECGLPVPPSWE